MLIDSELSDEDGSDGLQSLYLGNITFDESLSLGSEDGKSYTESVAALEEQEDSGEMDLNSDSVPSANDEGIHDAAAAEPQQPQPNTDWQSVVDDLFTSTWPNSNWSVISRLLNIIACTDRDADVVLDTFRKLDWTLSIPTNVAELRRVEKESLGTNK